MAKNKKNLPEWTQGLNVVDHKWLDNDSLLLITEEEGSTLMLMANAEGTTVDYFGGYTGVLIEHTREDLGRYFGLIGTVEEYHRESRKFRRKMSALLVSDNA